MNRCVMFFLFLVFPVVGMSRELDPKKYYNACREIDRADAQKAKNDIRCIRYSQDSAYVVQSKHELELSKQHLAEKRERVLREFQNHYKISDYHWQWARYTTHECHIAKEKSKSQFFAYKIDDKGVPEMAMLLISKELNIRGINVSRVDFLSTMMSPFVYGVAAETEKSAIAINPLLWHSMSRELQKFASVCAVEELMEELSLLPSNLKDYWVHLVESDKQRDSTGFERFRNMTKIVSMYSACLRNKETAVLVKKYAHCMINPCFTSDDYAFISAAARRWQVLSAVSSPCIAWMYLPELKNDTDTVFRNVSDSPYDASGSGSMTSVSEESSSGSEDGVDKPEEFGYVDHID